MATTTSFSIPFSSPYTLEEDIDFRAFYTGEGLYYVKTRVIGYNAHQLIAGVQSQGQKERKVAEAFRPCQVKHLFQNTLFLRQCLLQTCLNYDFFDFEDWYDLK